MDLLALADFNLVAIHGGFGRASRATLRPKATLSRHVSVLEAALGVQLIERGNRTLRLTDAGRTLASQAGALLSQLTALGESISEDSQTPRGRLRISAPVVFADIALSAVAAKYAQTYPDVEIEIVADERYVIPVEEDFDIVVRANPARDEQMVGRLILRDERLVVAPPSMVKPLSEDEQNGLASINAVLLTHASYNGIWRFGGPAVIQVRTKPVLRLSSLAMVHQAILAGAGAGILPRMLVEQDIAAGRLTSWGKPEENGDLELWALHSSGRRASAKIKLFLDALSARFPDKTYVSQTISRLRE